MMRTLALAPVAMLLSSVPVSAVNMKCIDRDGRCIVVTVNGQRNVKLSKATKKMLAGIKRAPEWMMDVRYELPAPIQGELDVKADQTREAGDWFGDGRVAEVQVIPLDDVDLQTGSRIIAADSVRIGGAAPLVQQHVLEENTLPAGRYLLGITLRGVDNWDRQVLFFTVK